MTVMAYERLLPLECGHVQARIIAKLWKQSTAGTRQIPRQHTGRTFNCRRRGEDNPCEISFLEMFEIAEAREKH